MCFIVNYCNKIKCSTIFFLTEKSKFNQSKITIKYFTNFTVKPKWKNVLILGALKYILLYKQFIWRMILVISSSYTYLLKLKHT